MSEAIPLSCLHQAGKFFSYTIIVEQCITVLAMPRGKATRVYHIRFTEQEWNRLEQEATRREITTAQVIRDLLKDLDKASEPVSN